MNRMWLSSDEERVLRFVAHCFEKNERYIYSSESYENVGMDHQQFQVALKRLMAFGAVGLADDLGDEIVVTPLARSVDLVRDLDRRREEAASVRPDLIEQIKMAARKNPWIAGIIILVLVLTALSSLANNLWNLVAKILEVFQ